MSRLVLRYNASRTAVHFTTQAQASASESSFQGSLHLISLGEQWKHLLPKERRQVNSPLQEIKVPLPHCTTVHVGISWPLMVPCSPEAWSWILRNTCTGGGREKVRNKWAQRKKLKDKLKASTGLTVLLHSLNLRQTTHRRFAIFFQGKNKRKQYPSCLLRTDQSHKILTKKNYKLICYMNKL